MANVHQHPVKTHEIPEQLLQQERFARKRNVTCNAGMGTRELKAHCALDDTTIELLKLAMNELKLSACTSDRILEVARTTWRGRRDS